MFEPRVLFDNSLESIITAVVSVKEDNPVNCITSSDSKVPVTVG